MMAHLKVRANGQQFATGGYVLIAHVNNDAKDFLLTAIVTETIGTAINQDMDIIDSIHLDMSHLKVAGRINLTAWQLGEERYLSFLKGRGEIAHYFKKFLGCNDLIIARRETQKLIDGLGLFATEQHLEPEKRDNLLVQAHDYLNELVKNGTPLSLDAFANHLWSNAPDDLLAVLTDEALALSDGFVPDKKTIKKLVKFTGSAAGWRLEFDRDALRCNNVRYNKDNNTLILSNVPDELRLELLEELDDG
jgi:nucleoid-associated protein